MGHLGLLFGELKKGRFHEEFSNWQVCPRAALSRFQKALLDSRRPNLMFLDLLVQGAARNAQTFSGFLHLSMLLL